MSFTSGNNRVKNTQEEKLNEQIKEIDKIKFGIMSPKSILDMSKVHIKSLDAFEAGRPKPGGLLDLHLGTLEKNVLCQTCVSDIKECPGHFGHIELAEPLFHVGFIKYMLTVLKCVCYHCSRIMISKNSSNYKKILDIPHSKIRVKKLLGFATDTEFCEFSDVEGGCKKTKMNYNFSENIKIVAEYNVTKTEKRKLTLTAADCLRILKKINEEDYHILGFSENNRPEWLILTILPVPPICVRPSNFSNGISRHEHDITQKYVDILRMNDHLNQVKKNNAKNHGKNDILNDTHIQNLIQGLQFQVAVLFNSDAISNKYGGPQKHLQRMNKPYVGIEQRLKGKNGWMRGNLLGKRADFSSRTVISGDPNISINEVGVPESIAKILTYPEKVSVYNQLNLTQAVKLGPFELNGANYVITPEGIKYDLKRLSNIDNVLPLKPGSIVERHMKNGDLVYFNRQPSLHKYSFQTHKARIMSGNTFRLNLSVTTPYNADFDGDEMNLSPLMSEETKAEAFTLSLVENNIISPQSNRPIMGLVQDTLLSIFMMSDKNLFFDRKQLNQFITINTQWNGTIPTPTILKPKSLWSGKQIISMFLPKDFNYNAMNDTVYPEYEKFPFNEYSNIKILQGYFVHGILDKKNLGAAYGSIIHHLFLDYGATRTRIFFDDMQACSRAYLTIYGYSLGMKDLVSPKNILITEEDKTVFKGLIPETKTHFKDIREKSKYVIQLADDYIRKWKQEKKSLEEIEKLAARMLNQARGNLSKDVEKYCAKNNYFEKIIRAGSKGTKINLAQILACVGQQNVDGGRIQYGFKDRVYPHSKKFDDGATMKGFVGNNYINGLHPLESLNHAISGREGMMDTAVKTSTTGYLQRRLEKSLEDTSVQYDGTVRNSSGHIIQWNYGEDGFDGTFLESNYRDFSRLSREEYEKVFLWNEEKEFVNHKQAKKNENNRMKKDYELMMYHRQKFPDKSVLIPVPFERMIEKILLKRKKDQLITFDDVSFILSQALELQSQIFQQALQFQPEENSSESMASVILRQHLSSKRIIHQWKFSKNEFVEFKKQILSRWQRGYVHPGEMIGGLAAQSMGEPSTQLTLNTFHSLGAENNITMGVPRIREIVNATEKIKTPYLRIPLLSPYKFDKNVAEFLCASLPYTLLKDFVTYTEVHYDYDLIHGIRRTKIQSDTFVCKLFHIVPENPRKIPEIDHTEWNPYVGRIMLNKSKLSFYKISVKDIIKRIKGIYGDTLYLEYSTEFCDETFIRIRCLIDPSSLHPIEDSIFMEELVKQICNTLYVSGIERIHKAFVKEEKKNDRMEYFIETEGSNLVEVMLFPQVDKDNIYCNDFQEVNSVFGLEAARMIIIKEIQAVFAHFNIYVNVRHIMLLADVMCRGGAITSNTRHGLNRMETGPLVKSSFEETSKMLLEASRFDMTDETTGVIESVILGKRAKIGSGKPEVFMNIDKLSQVKNSPEEESQRIYLEQLELKNTLKADDNLSNKTANHVNSVHTFAKVSDIDDILSSSSLKKEDKEEIINKPPSVFRSLFVTETVHFNS